MGSLTILGLGPAGPELLTREACEVLDRARELYVRTRRHPTLRALPFAGRVRSFDVEYQRQASLDDVYASIAARVVALGARPGGVVYAVPGHPAIGERSVQLARALARERGVEVRIIAGLSFLEPVLSAVEVDPLAAGLQIVDASDVVAAYFGSRPARDPFAESPRAVDPTRAALVTQLDSAPLVASVKIALLEWFPPDHRVTLVSGAGSASMRVEVSPLAELSQVPVDHLSSLFLPPLDRLSDLASFDTLRAITAQLRAPGGCPWDREQSHLNLKPELLEESYEALSAIDAGSQTGDWSGLSEELGDLMMNLCLHAQIATEAENFSLEDVLRGINAKLIRRHPHVFGDVVARGTDEVLANWDQIKSREKSSAPGGSRFESVPRALPSLARAQIVQSRAARAGFVWSSVADDWRKLDEELGELRAATEPDHQREELGDVLLVLATLARRLDLNAEDALRLAVERFIHRFDAMEAAARENDEDFAQTSLERKLELWALTKRRDGDPE